MGVPSYSLIAQNNISPMAAYAVSAVSEYIVSTRLTHRSHLVVVALAQTQFWQTARGQIEYNLTHLRQGVRRIIQALEA